jgi:AraC-like DNA-binding protein
LSGFPAWGAVREPPPPGIGLAWLVIRRTFLCMATLTLGWVQVAALVGALQGFFLALVLIAQRNNRTANRLLALLMVEFTIYLAAGPYYTTGFIRANPHFFGISYHTTWVFGPLVYLYARAASDRSWRFTSRALWHFVPVAVVVTLSWSIYTLSGAEKIALFQEWVTRGITPPLKYIDPLRYLSGISYSVATMLYLRGHRRDVEQSYSNIARVNLRWLLWFSVATGSIWVMATGFKVSRASVSLRDEYITFAMALLVYGIGYLGLRQPEIFRHVTVELPVAHQPGAELTSPVGKPRTATAKIQHTSLGEQEATLLRTSLLAVMEREQPWKNAELTLSDLARRLNTSTHKLSEVLNAQVGQSFYDFVNGYRVREVQRRITAGDARSLKMLALAMDAGFASKSTFNEAFKKHTSQTPSSYRQAIGA